MIFAYIRIPHCQINFSNISKHQLLNWSAYHNNIIHPFELFKQWDIIFSTTLCFSIFILIMFVSCPYSKIRYMHTCWIIPWKRFCLVLSLLPCSTLLILIFEMISNYLHTFSAMFCISTKHDLPKKHSICEMEEKSGKKWYW